MSHKQTVSLFFINGGGFRFGDGGNGQPAKLSAPADSTQGAPGLTGLRDTVEDETVVASN
jgi:hypothetical protein